MKRNSTKTKKLLKTFEESNILMTKAECERLIRDLDDFYKSIIQQVKDYTQPNWEGTENE